jgi:hypothetical protein
MHRYADGTPEGLALLLNMLPALAHELGCHTCGGYVPTLPWILEIYEASPVYERATATERMRAASAHPVRRDHVLARPTRCVRSAESRVGVPLAERRFRQLGVLSDCQRECTASGAQGGHRRRPATLLRPDVHCTPLTEWKPSGGMLELSGHTLRLLGQLATEISD